MTRSRPSASSTPTTSSRALFSSSPRNNSASSGRSGGAAWRTKNTRHGQPRAGLASGTPDACAHQPSRRTPRTPWPDYVGHNMPCPPHYGSSPSPGQNPLAISGSTLSHNRSGSSASTRRPAVAPPSANSPPNYQPQCSPTYCTSPAPSPSAGCGTPEATGPVTPPNWPGNAVTRDDQCLPSPMHTTRSLDTLGTLPVTSFAQGVPARVVMEMLGHSQISLTLGPAATSPRSCSRRPRTASDGSSGSSNCCQNCCN